MRTPTLSCPHGRYKNGQIRCEKAGGGPCGHQYFKRCKGWWALMPSADDCLLRKEEKHG